MIKKRIVRLAAAILVFILTASFSVLAAEPDAEVSKGVILTLVPDESAANKVVFDITYVGLPDTLTQLSLNIPVEPELIADSADKKDVTFEFTEGFMDAKASYNDNTDKIVVTGASLEGFSDPDHRITRVTIHLAETLKDTLKLELTKATFTDLNKTAYMLDGEDDTRLDESYIYVTPDMLGSESEYIPAESKPSASPVDRSTGGDSSSASSSSSASLAPISTLKPTTAPEKGSWIEPTGDESVLIIVHYNNGVLSSVEKKRFEGRDRIDTSGFNLKQDDGIYLYDVATGVLSKKIPAEKE